MLSLTYDDATAEDCVAIASSSIEAIHMHQSSSAFGPTTRFSSVMYIISCLLPLVCVIIRNDNLKATRQNASAAFRKGYDIVQAISANYTLARHALRRSDRIFKAALQVIERGNSSTAEFEIPDTEIPAPQYGDFFDDLRLDAEWNMLDPNFDMPLPYSPNACDQMEFTAQAVNTQTLWPAGSADYQIPLN